MIQIDMDMPKSCTKCRFNSCCDDCECVPNRCKAVDFDDDDKAIIGRFRDWYSDEEPEEGYTPETRRMEWCPLMESGDGWIPVTEQLPKEKGLYLVTYHPCYWDNVEEDKTVVGIDSFRGKSSWAHSKYQRVTAWKPMPKPYKEKKNETL